MKKSLLWIICCTILLCIGLYAWFSVNSSVTGNTEKTVTIEKGSSADQIATILIDNKILKNSFFFKIILKLKSEETKLKAGTYRIPAESSIINLIDLLSKGKVATIRITIHEGLTMNSIATLLESNSIVKRSSFIEACTNIELLKKLEIHAESAEGYLYPDTYTFNENDEAERVLEILVQTFFRQLRLIHGEILPSSQRIKEIVILASILEREYRIPSEAPKMASVFQNRIAIGMPLQSCATVVYILTEILHKPHPKVVLYKDLQIANPYNTYIYRGLPPGPISNPGETSLSAVLNPEKSDYLYFRLIDESTGKHKFSKTFVEHLEESIPVKGY